ncbi:hypothetical protein FNV43_RR21313 [Rhamnella rubrinervis]|uniref:Bifunctional inhibitor/plant lipid transfer protein/seed storage helical domain-containing protein n=1 Tax=Rhamnella rubrinervis TaxID=2594499 RepID=A0A8K0GXN6_9ROSA|nr:hypothetical protein FNV43_RR21313 [Rhamnella rubrinervis]
MAFLHPPTALLLCFILALLFVFVLSQDPISSTPTMVQCAPQLLPLTSCAPFIQGTAQSPTVPCCNSLRQLYNQQPHCLCLLLNDTTLSSFPINTTLALQLPSLCNLQADSSTCSGVPVPPTSPGSEVSLGSNTNSTTAGSNSSATTGSNSTVGSASPTLQAAPRPIIMGMGLGNSASMSLRTGGDLTVVMMAMVVACLLRDVLFSI